MSVDSVLDGAFNILLAKAQRKLLETPPVPPKPTTANFEWTGGGLPIVATVDPITLASVPTTVDPVTLVVPYPCSIGFVYMLAGDGAGKPVVVTASADVQLTQITAFGTSMALSGTGLPPQMLSASAALIVTTNWQPNLITGDILIARLTSFTGLATWVSLHIQLVPTDVSLGLVPVVDTGGATLTDSSGATLVLRG